MADISPPPEADVIDLAPDPYDMQLALIRLALVILTISIVLMGVIALYRMILHWFGPARKYVSKLKEFADSRLVIENKKKKI